VQNHITPPNIISLSGPKVKVLSSGRVTDRFFKRAEAVKRRPERLELDTLDGMSVVRVQFIVSGRGRFTLTVEAAKGGLITSEQTLP